jgi:hypothetical protein
VGVAISVNRIDLDTKATVDGSTLEWASGASGRLDVEADSTGSIQAYAYWFEFLPWAKKHWGLTGKPRKVHTERTTSSA